MLDSCVQVQRFKRIRKLKAIAMLMRLVALCQCFTGIIQSSVHKLSLSIYRPYVRKEVGGQIIMNFGVGNNSNG